MCAMGGTFSPGPRRTLGRTVHRILGVMRENIVAPAPLQAQPGGEVVRVLHVITGLGVGGAESMLASLVGAHPGALDQSVVSLVPNGFHAASIRAGGTRVTELALDSPLALPREIWRLAALVRATRPHAVQGWMYHGNLAALAAVALSGRRRRTRVAWGIRCSDRDSSTESLQLRAVIKFGATFAGFGDLLVANSQAGLAYHQQLGYQCDRTVVVHNGIDTKRYRPNAEARAALRASLGFRPEDVVLAHVARVHPMKDHKNFVAALRHLPRVKALAVGVGTDGLPDLPNLSRLGRRSDIPALLAASDVVVSSSAFGEGFSNAMAEGMSTGLVPVATDVGDARVIVGETGWVVAPRSPRALADALQEIASLDPAALAARGARARDRILSRFSLEAAIDEFTRLYQDLVKGLPSSAIPRS
jgi:glycosyltransferase involved in cell wall biosynthesis